MKLEVEIKLKRNGFSLESAELLDGSVFGIFGPSGCGKTTLLHVIAGLIRPQAGRIGLDGDMLFDSATGVNVAVHQRRIGLVFQEGRLFPHLSVRRNLGYGMSGDPGRRRWSMADIASLFQISHLLDKMPAELSGGERQRVALGRAILMSPRMLLLDEPLASLDAGIKGEIIPFLRLMKEQVGIPMIYVSHDLSEILDLTGNLLVMDGGRILSRGSLQDVLADSRSAGLLRHTGLVNILKLRLARALPEERLGLYVLDGDAKGPGDESCGIYAPLTGGNPSRILHAVLKADDIILSLGPPEGLSTRNCICGVMAEIRVDGDKALCIVDGAVRLLVEITPLAVKAMKLQPGQKVHCLFKTHSLRFL